MNDKAGRPIKPGDLIIYGHLLGQSAGLQYGLVLGPRRPYDKLLKEERGEVLDVHGIDSGWDHLEPQRLSKKGSLQYGSRIVVVTREQVPANVLTVLDELSKEYFPEGVV